MVTHRHTPPRAADAATTATSTATSTSRHTAASLSSSYSAYARFARLSVSDPSTDALLGDAALLALQCARATYRMLARRRDEV